MSDDDNNKITSLSVAAEAAEKLFHANGAVSEKKELDDKSIKKIVDSIDIYDSNAIIYFGSSAQQQLTDIADNILDGVKNKDTAAAGSALSNIVAAIRGFDVSALTANNQPGFFARLLGKAKPVAQFLQQYEDIENCVKIPNNCKDDLKIPDVRLSRPKNLIIYDNVKKKIFLSL